MQPDSPLAIHISPDTRQAFLDTHYRVLGATPFVLRINARCAPLAALHQRHGVSCSAFITACNPYCRPLADDDNAQRHAALRDELARRGIPHLEGIGQHPSNDWPGEPSWLVIGIAEDAARELGTALEQAAIVWAGADAVPRLIELVPVAIEARSPPSDEGKPGHQQPGDRT